MSHSKVPGSCLYCRWLLCMLCFCLFCTGPSFVASEAPVMDDKVCCGLPCQQFKLSDWGEKVCKSLQLGYSRSPMSTTIITRVFCMTCCSGLEVIHYILLPTLSTRLFPTWPNTKSWIWTARCCRRIGKEIGSKHWWRGHEPKTELGHWVS